MLIKENRKNQNANDARSKNALSARRLLSIYLPQLQTVALRKHNTLRKSCDEYLKKLNAQNANQKRARLQSADTYFEPFRIACQTKHPETVHVALNAIQNLVAGGYLTGEKMVKVTTKLHHQKDKDKDKDKKSGVDKQGKDKEHKEHIPLIDVIVTTICECADIPHSSTQLMVINTLLNLCTCGTTEVHAESLSLVITSLYYIFLNSRDWDVQTSATATLTQTMSILFARVESVSSELTQLQEDMRRVEAKRRQQREEKKQSQQSQQQQSQQQQPTESAQDDEYIMVSGSQDKDHHREQQEEESSKYDDDDDDDDDLCSSEEFNGSTQNAEDVLVQIPLTTEDMCSSMLQSIINNVTAADEERVAAIKESEAKLEVVHSIVDDLVSDALQIHVERVADAYKRRGNQEYSKNRHRTALKYYQRAHELNPTTPIYLVNMGITHYVLSELSEARRLCIEAVQVGKTHGAQIQWIAKAFSTLAHVAYKQQKISACIRYYRLSLSEHEDAKIRRKLAEIISEFGDTTNNTEDLEFWQRVVSRDNYDTPENSPPPPPQAANQNSNNEHDDREYDEQHKNGYKPPVRRSQSQLVALLAALHSDCFLVLEELCNFAAKQKVDRSFIQSQQWSSFLFSNKNDLDVINVRSRSLSLRLINSAMNSVGAHLSSTKKWISLIRTYLVPTLCANVTSTIESIIQMAMNIFKALVHRFGHHLVSEVGVLFDSFLLLASSPNSTFQQKLEVLKVLADICSDGRTTVSLFLNYDCSNQATRPKVFQRIISTVEQINNTKLESRDWINEEEANALRSAALKCFVTIMSSLVQWQNSRSNLRSQRSPQQQSNSNLRQSSSENNFLKPIQISAEKSVEKKQQSEEDLVRTGSLSSMNGNGVHHPSPPPTVEDSVSQSNMEVPIPFDSNNSNTPNYHDIFVSQKKKEETFRNGMVKFNIKPSHGVKYLVQYGLLENKPESVAQFMRTAPSLTPTAVGEYLGGDKPFQIEVMHYYVDSISFQGMSFIDAFRHLCSLFMIPGEAQKIDRVLERFAARYCSDNTDQFSSGDVAYILAYSCMLLHSNIYNVNVKKKMTKYEFIKTNNSATKEVSDEILTDIYDNICAKEMKLKPSDHLKVAKVDQSSVDISPSRKMRNLHFESRRIIRDVKRKIKDEYKNNVELTYVDPDGTDDKVCELIFSASCYAVLGTFSVVIQTSDVMSHITECYGGYRACIQLAAHLDLQTECEAFVNSLYRFTLLGTLKPVQMKHIQAMRLLLDIGHKEGDALRSSWKEIIKCCSEIDILHLMATQAPADAAFWLDKKSMRSLTNASMGGEGGSGGGSGSGGSSRQGSITSSDDIMQAVKETGTANHESRKLRVRTKIGADGILRFASNPNAQLVYNHIDHNSVAKIFTGTERLASNAIVDFVKALCQVSYDEIHNHANPRSFCLQKIVDIAHFNMHRVRFEWIQLWKILSAHFEDVGCHRNQRICIDAIDNLRQLADKFLQREELTTFNFQKDFLKPFLTIVAQSQSVDIQEYIIECMARLIRARYKNIKSGWKCVFGTLGVAARASNENLVTTTFNIMIEVLDLYFPMIAKMSTRPSHHLQSIFKIPEESTIDLTVTQLHEPSRIADVLQPEQKLNDDVEDYDDDEEEEDEAATPVPADQAADDNESKEAPLQQLVPPQTPQSYQAPPTPPKLSGPREHNILYDNEEQKQEHISKIQLLRIDAISDCVDTLLAFVANRYTDLSINGVDHICKVAQYLFESDQYLAQQLTGSAMMESDLMLSVDNAAMKSDSSIAQLTSSMDGGTPDLSRPLIKAWFLCLLGLSRGVNDGRLEVRTHCLQVLFRLLKAQGELFDAIMWQRVFERLLFPIFAELRQNPAAASSSSPSMTPTQLSKPASMTPNSYAMAMMDASKAHPNSSARGHQAAHHHHHEFPSLSGHGHGRRRSSSDAGASSSEYVSGTPQPQSTRRQIKRDLTRGVSGDDSKPLYDDYSWLETTCHPALSNLVELFHQFFTICQPLLHDVVSLMCMFIGMKNSATASQIGHQCLKRLIQTLGAKFTSSQWSIVVNDLIGSLKRLLPTQLKSEELRAFFNLPAEHEHSNNKNDKKRTHNNTSESGGQNGHEMSVPSSILNIDKFTVLCHSQLSLMKILCKISKQHLKKLTLYQCVDILNAFQASSDFIASITQDTLLMNKLQFLQCSKHLSTSPKQPMSVSVILYTLESTAFYAALSVLFECKNVSIKHMSQMQLQTTQPPASKASPNEQQQHEIQFPLKKLDFAVDETVQSQILVDDDANGNSSNSNKLSNTPPPPMNISSVKPLVDGIVLQKSLPEERVRPSLTVNTAIVNHKMTTTDIRQLSEYRLIPLGIQLMQLMFVRERKQQRPPQHTKYLVTVVAMFLKHLHSVDHFSEDEFRDRIRVLFPYLSRLVQCSSLEIRELVSKILLARVSQCILQPTREVDGQDNDDDEESNTQTVPLNVLSTKNNSV